MPDFQAKSVTIVAGNFNHAETEQKLKTPPDEREAVHPEFPEGELKRS